MAAFWRLLRELQLQRRLSLSESSKAARSMTHWKKVAANEKPVRAKK
jgi:hypothetical protein